MVNIGSKVKTIDELIELANEWKEAGKIVVTTNGTFDLFHVGHGRLFYRMRELGGALIVLVNSDASVRRNKGLSRPYVSEKDRAEVVSFHEGVDCVGIFPDDTPLDYLSRIKPNIHAKGGTYDPSRTDEEAELVKGWGGKIHR